jgi:ankyrin repeat protein
MDASVNISNYLLDQKDESQDIQGNTLLHLEVANVEKTAEDVERMAANGPHLMYMVNSEGQTPLDVAINTTIQEKEAKVSEEQEKKAVVLIEMMEKFSTNGALMYVKKPNRVELRFEKAFILSVVKNNLLLIQAFPDDTIKTCLVTMKPLGDLEQGKDKEDLITTPLHLSCKLSNDEAVRQLINEQSYDVNILCNEKSPLGELLSTACYLDFSILNFLMKKRKPCINSGVKLPLNQAILRGNPFIIRSLIEFGKPHPYLRDSNGKCAIHMAAAKLDMQTFDSLVTECGADPMQTDSEGNTILHILTLGVITDAEYDFVKFCL